MAFKKRSRKQSALQAQKVSLTYFPVASSATDETQKRKTTATGNNISNKQEDEHEMATDNQHGQAEHKTGDDSTRSQVEHETADNNPGSQAFSTTEILEAILEHLPARTLFGVQRVSKAFQATILGSQRIQHKMFLRIKNETQVPWALRRNEISEPDFEQVPVSGRNEKGARRRLLTPVDINTTFDHVFSRRGVVTAYVDKEGTSELNRRRPFTKQGLEQLSIGKSFISDPHCDHIEVKLSLTLGVRLPTRITVTSAVKSRTPLTIDSLIAKALDQDYAWIKVDWRGDGHTFSSAAVEQGVPRQVLDRLKRRTGLELFFRFSGLSFGLYGVVAPTIEERAAVARFSDA
jgi:hypothetical protein